MRSVTQLPADSLDLEHEIRCCLMLQHALFERAAQVLFDQAQIESGGLGMLRALHGASLSAGSMHNEKWPEIPALDRTSASRLLSAARLREQPQDLEIQPDQRHREPEGAEPLHVLRRAPLRAGFDEVEVEHQVQRRDHHDEHAEQDAEQAALVDEADRLAEQHHREVDQIEQRDAAGGRHHAELEVLGGLDEARLVREQQAGQRSESEAHGLDHDARMARLEQGRQAAD